MRKKVFVGGAWAVISILCCVVGFDGAAYAAEKIAAAPKKLSIIRVTPTGEDVDGTRQIVLEFNRRVVPVGRMDRTADEVGITITPALNCQWRWLNTSSLACNLDEKDAMLPAT